MAQRGIAGSVWGTLPHCLRLLLTQQCETQTLHDKHHTNKYYPTKPLDPLLLLSQALPLSLVITSRSGTANDNNAKRHHQNTNNPHPLRSASSLRFLHSTSFTTLPSTTHSSQPPYTSARLHDGPIPPPFLHITRLLPLPLTEPNPLNPPCPAYSTCKATLPSTACTT